MHSTTPILFCLATFITHGISQIDPGTVPISTRESWCRDQQSSCPILCDQSEDSDPMANDCDPETLSFSCLCGNGLQPNASEYSQPIPYYECTEANNQCENNCGSDSNCASQCRTARPCGAQNPTRVNATSTTSSTTPSATSTSGSGDFGSFGGPEESESAARNIRFSGNLFEKNEHIGTTMLSLAFLSGFVFLL